MRSQFRGLRHFLVMGDHLTQKSKVQVRIYYGVGYTIKLKNMLSSMSGPEQYTRYLVKQDARA